jgi:Holliday junction resolvase RusA-like endonuclease
MTDKRSLAFFVRGLARPQGSGQPRVSKAGKPYLITKTANLASWRHAVATVLSWEWHWPPIDGPVGLGLIFVFPRPKSLKKGRRLHTTRPDGSKLLRAVEDALTGVAYVDDSRVQSAVSKVYGDEPGAHIYICELEDSVEGLFEFRLQQGQREFDVLKEAKA